MDLAFIRLESRKCGHAELEMHRALSYFGYLGCTQPKAPPERVQRDPRETYLKFIYFSSEKVFYFTYSFLVYTLR